MPPAQKLAANLIGMLDADIGANLTDPMFLGSYHGKTGVHPPDLDRVLQRAWSAGLTRIVITATNLEESRVALALARTDARLYCTAGVHPTRCGEIEAAPEGAAAYWEALRGVLEEGKREGKTVAVGECGLDGDRLQFCDMVTQQRWFEAHFRLAAEVQLPMFLHLRAAAPAFLDTLARQPAGALRGVVHSFDGTLEEAHKVLSYPGLFIGLNGCSLKTGKCLRLAENVAVAAALPLDRILLETDAPWCEIRPSHAAHVHVQTRLQVRDKKKWDPDAAIKSRNEPANLRQVLEAVAGARGMEAGALAAQVHANALALFFSG
ncbi:Putative deoxyribonuclease TATDN1 [Auxenochlorella protothecoides]|uniref:Putative deoxyribonuclease TATDN1 n=1 Tax=Auxenochlorella protothecoides TaxID=3075 RepID=A0A087SS70_AUXPR|nr:Putative deoxyribonuclease TATDN1 [Auxenochlorella protothecoides]KFM28574.1 Putative deoxyribonuclease TATDN1 [Auxenochlorella protothecoides]RMZ53308.1 hypothetical protein APUTEX25_004796 [Auxenochlorella protothecoides]|eukprot:RMZ53308.1 hypothetical protein APUTEX25_004796 [Auxenochlorella protothecoides]